MSWCNWGTPSKGFFAFRAMPSRVWSPTFEESQRSGTALGCRGGRFRRRGRCGGLRRGRHGRGRRGRRSRGRRGRRSRYRHGCRRRGERRRSDRGACSRCRLSGCGGQGDSHDDLLCGRRGTSGRESAGDPGQQKRHHPPGTARRSSRGATVRHGDELQGFGTTPL